MKLSHYSTGDATDVLCEIAPYISNIVTDEELMNELKAAISYNRASTKAEQMALVCAKITKIIPIILKKRKQDLFGVLAVLNEKTIEEIGKQNIIVTMSQIRDMAKDKELLDFFKSCTDMEESE